MKTTAQTITARAAAGKWAAATALTAALWASAASSAWAAQSSTLSALVGAAALGQAQPSAKTQAQELLRLARVAMKAGNYETAESYLSRAEKMDVKWGVVQLGDTPAKVRRDLDRAKPSGSGSPDAGPSGKPKVTDPFQANRTAVFEMPADKKEAAAPANAASFEFPSAPSANNGGAPQPGGGPTMNASPASANVPTPLPPAGAPTARPIPASTPGAVPQPIPGLPPQSTPGVPPLLDAGTPSPIPARAAVIEPGNPGYDPYAPANRGPIEAVAVSATDPNAPRKNQSDSLLLEARRALSRRDLNRANECVQRAKAIGLKYDVNEDSPERVEALLRKHANAAQLRAGGDRSEGAVRSYGDVLMEQAQWLYRWRQYEDAERLIVEAKSLPIQWEFFNRPDNLQREIEKAKNAGNVPLPGASQGRPVSEDSATSNTGDPMADKTKAVALLAQAQIALNSGDLATAERLARQADAMKVPDDAFTPGEVLPAMMVYEVIKAKQAQSRRVAGNVPGAGLAGNQPGTNLPGPNAATPLANNGGPRPVGNPAITQVNAQAPTDTGLTAPDGGAKPAPKPVQPPIASEPPPGQLLDGTAAEQQAAVKGLMNEVQKRLVQARQMQDREPKQARELLIQTGIMVDNAKVDQSVKNQIRPRVGRVLAEIEQYIDRNKAKLELEDKNKAVVDQNERDRQYKIEVDKRLTKLVDDYNRLVDQQRYHEAEQVALQAASLAPESPLAIQLKRNSRTLRALFNNDRIREDKEVNTLIAYQEVDEASTPHSGRPMVFSKDWREITDRRRRLTERSQPRSKRELEIREKLKMPVSLQFDDKPLVEVVEYLGRLAKTNIHLDPRGLSEQGIRSDTKVSINVDEIMLQSALNILLDPLNLTYQIKDEVLKITSVELRDGDVYQVIYNVADLVIPIPNFVPSSNMGLSSSLQDAYRTASMYTGVAGMNNPAPVQVMAGGGQPLAGGSLNPAVLGQQGSSGPGLGASQRSTGPGPGGLGGGVQPDFDSLIELITSTVEPNTWSEAGGSGAIAPFEGNLSLVISQTNKVHEKIADLLDQLRRLQDLQVTIEVRFITLNDNFFERIGIDFDFDLNDNTDRPYQVFGRPVDTPTTYVAPNDFTPNGGPRRDVQDRDHGPSATVGLTPQGLFSADLDLPFQQGSYGLATPQFGGFQPGAGATFGFAILSDIEAFFLIEASQGDRRSNVLQAPKVTLFNGQQAFVSDTSQSPFVISVIPVVGDFAAALQPVIVVLSEGTFLTVQAVVSNDRRFVRLTIVPFFSDIGEVNTFTFTGSSSTQSDTSTSGTDTTNPLNRTNIQNSTTAGTTIQLPTFSFVTVTTTVSVPDGGTVLLGGIKRLSEGRNEFGVPMLSKLPYVNRLFKNVGIGRETQSLMMMVTPRIIIQEEEENLMGVNPQATTP